MGSPLPVVESYLGFMQDVPRHELPGGFMWNMVDWIPDFDAGLRARYGWSRLGSQTFAQIHTGAGTTGNLIAYCPFPSGEQICVAVPGSGLFSFTPAGVGSFIGNFNTVSIRPVYHRNKLVSSAPGNDLSIYDGTAISIFSSGIPQAACGTLYGDYTVFANTNAQNSNPQRAYFSAAGDPTTYDMTNSWIDMPGEIVGCQGLRSVLLFFTKDKVWRVRGTVPPQANVVGNLVREHLYDTGLLDERSIAVYGEEVIFANAQGVWLTDGATVKSLTEQGGISLYWQSLLSSYASGWGLVAGIYRGYYMISITDASGAYKDFLVCNLEQKGTPWFRFSGITANMFAHGTGTIEDLWFCNSNLVGQVGKMSGVWESGVSGDPLNAYSSLVETPFFRGWQHWHRKWIPTNATSVWKYLYVNYDAPVEGGSHALDISYTTSPELGASYSSLGTLLGGSSPQRVRLPINRPARGIAFSISAGGPTYAPDIRLNDLELEYYTREGNR